MSVIRSDSSANISVNMARLADGSLFSIGRGVRRVETEDFIHWREPEPVVLPDSNDPEGFQINSMPVDLYEGLYLGLVGN